MIPDRLPHAAVVRGVAPPFLLFAALCIAGCGMPGAPQPPSLHLPERVVDLAALRTGNTVKLTWTMPRRTTDRVLLTGALKVHVCRKLDSDTCGPVADIEQQAANPGHYEDHLPAAAIADPPRLLTYFVEIRNKIDHAAGPSNPAYTVAGDAPPPITGLAAQVRPEGVLLRWPTPSTPEKFAVRLHRVLQSKPVTAPKSKGDPLNAAHGLPAEQTLEIDPGSAQALDKDAAFNQSYVYTAQRVSALTLDGHAFEVKGEPSGPLTVDTRDIFPPRSPEGLVAIAEVAEGAIDLSWSSNTEPDLAGYIVYRQEVAASSPVQRISPSAPLPAPAFRDTTAIAGHSYLYQVTAIDRDGNESPRSTAAQETLPKSQ
jgi:hypothetical protein